MLANSAFVRPVQPLKASLPIVVMFSGIVIEARPVQPLKASPPIDMTFSGIVIEERPVQPLNAWLPIEVIPVKLDNSLNDVIWVLFVNTVPRSLTAAASARLNSPSTFVSQFAMQRAFTLASAKTMPLVITVTLH